MNDISLDGLFASDAAGHSLGFSDDDISLESLFAAEDGGSLRGWDDRDQDEHNESEAALKMLANARIKRDKRGRRGAGRSVADDFEGAQQDAFLLLCDHVSACFEKGYTQQEQYAALQWVFGMQSPTTSRLGVTYITCCRALGIREGVVQARIQYQFSEDRVSLDIERICGLFIQLPPERIIADANYMLGEYAYEPLRWLWSHPGVTTKQLIAEGLKPNDIWILDDNGVLRESGGLWYLTGRNPDKFDVMAKANYRGWSSLF